MKTEEQIKEERGKSFEVIQPESMIDCVCFICTNYNSMARKCHTKSTVVTHDNYHCQDFQAITKIEKDWRISLRRYERCIAEVGDLKLQVEEKRDGPRTRQQEEQDKLLSI